MFLTAWRRQALVSVAVVLPLLASAFALALPVHDHGGRLDKDCLACRSTAESATEAVAPSATHTDLPIIATRLVFEEARVRNGQPRSITSRGPPPSA
jgi:hypothetical protein